MTIRSLALPGFLFATAILGMACTVSPAGGGGSGTFTCSADGDACGDDTECCSNICDNSDTCSPGASCTEDNSSCSSDGECCSLSCSGGFCDPSTCAPEGASCTTDNDCCDADYCDNGGCSPCVSEGNACTSDADCCSGVCDGGSCTP